MLLAPLAPLPGAPGFFGDADAFDAFGAEVWASRGWMEGELNGWYIYININYLYIYIGNSNEIFTIIPSILWDIYIYIIYIYPLVMTNIAMV